MIEVMTFWTDVSHYGDCLLGIHLALIMCGFTHLTSVLQCGENLSFMNAFVVFEEFCLLECNAM
jgi:hypothetical protein